MSYDDQAKTSKYTGVAPSTATGISDHIDAQHKALDELHAEIGTLAEYLSGVSAIPPPISDQAGGGGKAAQLVRPVTSPIGGRIGTSTDMIEAATNRVRAIRQSLRL